MELNVWVALGKVMAGKKTLNVFDRKEKGPKPKAERYNLEAAFI